MLRMIMSCAMVLGFLGLTTGCSWQGTSYDRGGDQHNGSAGDWNSGNGKPGTATSPAEAPAPQQSPAH